MKTDEQHPSESDNPLAGVLDRLMARERGEPGPPRERPAVEPRPRDARARRMLPVAGLGPDRGRRALRVIGRWALGSGMQPAVLDLASVEPPGGGEGDTVIPMAAIPCGPERLRGESPEVVAVLLQKVLRHETAADLLLVRVPTSSRMALMQAAFLAGGLVVPLEDSEDVAAEAIRIAREAAESFIDTAVWPLARSLAALTRFQTLARRFLDTEYPVISGESSELAGILERLAPPPEEGFTAALLAPGSAAPAAELFHLGNLRL